MIDQCKAWSSRFTGDLNTHDTYQKLTKRGTHVDIFVNILSPFLLLFSYLGCSFLPNKNYGDLLERTRATCSAYLCEVVKYAADKSDNCIHRTAMFMKPESPVHGATVWNKKSPEDCNCAAGGTSEAPEGWSVWTPATPRTGVYDQLTRSHIAHPVESDESGPHAASNRSIRNPPPVSSTCAVLLHLRLLLLLVMWLLPAVDASFGRDVQSLPRLSAPTNIPPAEMNALYDLYTSTNGAQWKWSEDPTAGIPWNFTDTAANNPCNDHWQGVNCSDYHVTGINLPSYNLIGTIPYSLDAFSGLQYLGFSRNHLYGNIPESLGNLRKLQRLYLNNNHITGAIPETVGNLSLLVYIVLNSNDLSGAIPDSLGDLTQLQILDLNSNHLTGVIPKTVGTLHSLQYFSVYNNRLVGTIPESLGDLTVLNYLFLVDNYLTGTIPDSLGQLGQLNSLQLESNFLTSTIPLALGNLTVVGRLFLNDNYLTGTIPDILSKLGQLKSLHLESNFLTNTIPQTLDSLTTLVDLFLNDNYLNGTIPDTISKLGQLKTLDVKSNYLTGTIPDSLSKLHSLEHLYLYRNNLNGTIPETLGDLTVLVDLKLHDNYLSGTIPKSLGNLYTLHALDLNTNHLTNSIPESLCKLSQLRFLSLYANKLTGTLSISFQDLTHLGSVFLHYNKFSGTIPDFIGALDSLQFLDLSDNLLTGTVPGMSNSKLQQLHLDHNQLTGRVPSLKRLHSLEVVLLQNNRLTGNLYNVFDPIKQLQVATIVLSNNQLSGTLPDAVFALKPHTFVGTSNCFEGPLPIDTICSNHDMVSFVIDGMSAASSCRTKLFVGPLSAYSLDYDIGGSLPTCLFQLPNITTLHLSGNGFTGSIPNNFVLSDTLTDLSLSHNTLTGSIPEQFQLKLWRNIDLTFNRLSDTLSPSFASNVSIELENNRLSGSIPAVFRVMTSVSILGSNTFSCSYDQSDLPDNDPDRRHYHCGSNSFNVLYYVWLGVGVCTVAGFAYCEWKYSVLRSILSRDFTLRNTNLYTTLATVYNLSFKCALYSLIVLLPLYSLCSTCFGTQTYAYAYQVSAVYMSGVLPFALFWLFWWVLLLGIGWFSCIILYVPSCRSVKSKPTYHSVKQTLGILLPYLLVDCVVVVGVNAAYVYVAVYESSSLLLPVQVLLSVFKVIWGAWVLPSLMTLLTQKKRSKIQDFTQILVNLLNNIAIPCLVVAVVSPNCFYNALVAAPAVTSTISYRDCSLLDSDAGQCLKYADISVPTSYDPPFTYNYQCSSSLITYYSPAFVSMCIVSTFVTPFAQFLCQWLYMRATTGTYWYKFLDGSLSGINKPLRDTTNIYDRSYLTNNKLVVTLVSMLGLVLTFGVMFPPLCVAFTISMFATALIFRVNVSRFVCHTNQQVDERLLELLKAECNSIDSMRVLKSSAWILVTVSCWFYTLFLFDTLGDAVGFEGAYWVLIVMPLMPLMLYIVYRAFCKYFARNRNLVSNSTLCQLDVGAGVEMQTINESSSVVHNILVVRGDPEKETQEPENGHV